MAIVSKKTSHREKLAILLSKRFTLEVQKKNAEAELKKVNDEIVELVRANGVRNQKGSYNTQYENYSVCHTAVVRQSVNADAARGLLVSNPLLLGYATIDKKSLDQAVKDGVLDKKDAAAILKQETSYRLDVREMNLDEEEGDGDE